jgi:hypothetical protein
MTILEASAITMAASLAVMATTFVIGLVGFARLRRRLDDVMTRLHLTLSSTHRLLDEAGLIVRNLRHLESRVQTNVDVVLDQVEPPIRVAAALLSALRTGVTSLFRNGDGFAGSSSQREGSTP